MQLPKSPASAGTRPVVSSAGVDIPFSAQARGWRVATEPRSLRQRILAVVFPKRAPRQTFQRGLPDSVTHQFHVESMKAVVHPRVN